MKSTVLATVTLGVVLIGDTATAGNVHQGYQWLADNETVLREGIVWNDRIGDGKDRYKSGGVTQSWIIPEGRLSDQRWFGGRISALELQARGLVMTPDNVMAGGSPQDRPYAQYGGLGLYLRTWGTPQEDGPATTVSVEDRVGVEFGYVGDPLPFFEIQEAIHFNGGFRINSANTVDSEALVNLEGRRTVRWHIDFNDTDLEFAPYLSASAGMRENSVRLGGDIIYGSSLEGRTWNIDPGIGALIPGGAMPRPGPHWMMWLGGDVGAIVTDAFLDGGFSGDSASVEREEYVARIRMGFMFENDPWALSYSLTWLSDEFEEQKHTQVIGAVSLKYRF
ncbi:MAG: lipid A-modifier LpxR family protein [Pseudomonadota bacterium]